LFLRVEFEHIATVAADNKVNGDRIHIDPVTVLRAW